MDGHWAKWAAVALCFAIGAALSLCLLRIEPARIAPGGEGAAVRHEREFRYRRIVCASPALAEIAFALGAGDRVVAVSEFTTYPPEALNKPTCGGLVNPNYEMIMSLRPDLILSQTASGELASFAHDLGVALEANELSDMASIVAAILRVGRAIEEEDAARALCARMIADVQSVSVRVAARAPVRVLVVAGREPGSLTGIYAAGPGTFLNDAILAAGGVNVFDDLPQPYDSVNKETLLERRPEVIVELHGMRRTRPPSRPSAAHLAGPRHCPPCRTAASTPSRPPTP